MLALQAAGKSFGEDAVAGVDERSTSCRVRARLRRSFMEGVTHEDVPIVVGIITSLLVASLCAAGAGLSRHPRTSLVLLLVALIPLLVWGVLGPMTIGALFLFAAGLLFMALIKVASRTS